MPSSLSLAVSLPILPGSLKYLLDSVLKILVLRFALADLAPKLPDFAVKVFVLGKGGSQMSSQIQILGFGA